MNNKSILFTKTELKQIFDALRKAIDYDDGFSQAYHNEGPESEKALKSIKKYKKIREKLGIYLNLSTKNRLDQVIEEAELVTINELKKLV